ncbi:MAG: hypothetical protein GY754_37255 [bacterium]|nr:hypothetical protein [bacterium]
MYACYNCNKELTMDPKVGVREACPACDADLHVCRNCMFYEPGSYNNCRENRAERVVDKEKYNYCDYFSFKKSNPNQKETGKKDDSKNKFDSLFK